jgi:selenide,water dikinase
MTKPIGVGMVTTAHKRGVAIDDDFAEAVRVMKELNIAGAEFGALPYVTAMTDVTGFGLLGHLLEVCDGSNLSAEIEYDKIPKLSNISHYASHMIYPDNTFRNWNSYQSRVEGIGSESLLTLCDPQTSGGLLVCVQESNAIEFEKVCSELGLALQPFGQTIAKQKMSIIIK